MQPLNVVVATRDTKAAAGLAATLNRYSRSVAVARSAEEVRSVIPKHRADLAVLDLETVGLEEVQKLCHEFDHTKVVCVHRLADEQMWAEALGAGAIDCFQSADLEGIVQAVDRSFKRSAA